MIICVRFQGKPFNITVIQVYALSSNAEEAEVEWFYEDLQDLLELTPRKDVLLIIGSVQFSSVAQSCLTLCNPMNRSMPGLPVHHQLPEFSQTHVHQVGDAIQTSHPLSSPSSPAPIPPSIRVFSNESTLPMKWPKYWSFSFSISPSNEHPGLISFRMDWLDLLAIQGTLEISFRMDWLDLLAVQGTLKSLLQNCSSKVSILRCSAFFIVQLSQPYMTTGKTVALDGPLLAS